MSVVTLKILGTTAGVPTRTRAHSAVYLKYDDGDEFSCLMDCGEGTQRQMLMADIGIMKINDIFITHWHGDHCLGLPGLLDTMGFEGRVRPVSIYAPESRRAYKCRNFMNYSMGKVKVDPVNAPWRGKRITTLLDTERFRIVSTPVKHGIPAVAFAFIEKDKICIDMEKALEKGLPKKGEVYSTLKKKGKINIHGRPVFLDDISFVKKGKKIVYSGDTEACRNVEVLSHEADVLIHDCTYFDDDMKKPHKHASFGEVMKIAEKAGVKRTILTHISRKYGDSEEIRKIAEKYEEVYIADDFFKAEVR